MCDDTCEDTKKLKQIIIDEGLYEAGMSIDDLQQIYKTLNRSKRTANDEVEYRELMSQTDLNCSNIESLKPEVDDIDGSDDTGTVVFISTPEKSTSNNSKIKKPPNQVAKKCIEFNFYATSNNKPVISATQCKDICPILYHHPAVLKLPIKKKSEIILLYLQNQLKRIRTNETKAPVSWSNPIIPHPNIKFNNDLCLEQEFELSEVADNTVTAKSENTNKDFITLKSGRRVMKRKNYGEVDSDDELKITNKKTKSNNGDSNTVNKNVELEKLIESPSTSSNKSQSQKADSDEDFCPTLNKKSKSNDNSRTVIVNKSTPVPKPSETTSKPKKWFNKLHVQKYTKALFTPDVKDRTNKIFDKLKAEDNNKNKPKKNSVKLDDISDLSDCDEIFPSTNTVANIHNETTPNLKRGKGTLPKKTQVKTRKKLNLKTANEEKQESSVTQIPTTNFYGKNKENELDASNNNKSTTSNMCQCPICFRSFPYSEIMEHASVCEQFDESQTDSLCVICNKYILNVDMEAHKFICLEKITEDSTEKSFDKNKSGLGFLCSVCDKYVVDCNQFEHASNCIATLNDG